MFEQTFVEGTGKTNKPWSVLVSTGIQIGLVALIIIIPLLNPDVLPKNQLSSLLVAPPPPPPPPPPPAAAPVKVVKVIPRQFDAGRLMAP
jgi:protein TonB